MFIAIYDFCLVRGRRGISDPFKFSVYCDKVKQYLLIFFDATLSIDILDATLLNRLENLFNENKSSKTKNLEDKIWNVTES